MTAAILPGPRAMPVLGSRINFASFVVDAPGHLRRLHAEYGEIASLARGTSDFVFVFSPRFNQIVLSDPNLFGNIDAASTPVRMPDGSSLARLYAGLTNMNGPPHRRLRRLMAAALPRARVEAYGADIVDIASRRIDRWRLGERIDVLAEMRVLTMAVAVRTLLGLEPEHEGRSTSMLLQEWMDTVFSVAAMAVPLDLPGLPYHRLLVLSRRLERVVREIIAAGRAGATGRHDVLSRLLQAGGDGDGMSDDELVGQTTFLFMAGHATTASALTWTLFLLCAHPRVLDDVHDEIRGALRGGPPDVAGLAALPLLDRVVKESLRLLPPVMWWSKVASAPAELGPYRVRAGAHVAFSPFVTHRLPERYPRPDRFEPDRWLDCRPGPYEYLPFSAGPRSCLGAGLAMTETKLVLATLLGRWRPELCAAGRIDQGGLMVSQPRRGLPVVLRRAGSRAGECDIRGNVRSLIELNGESPRIRTRAMPKKFRPPVG